MENLTPQLDKLLLLFPGIFGAASKATSTSYFQAQNCKSNRLLLFACQYGNCSAPAPFLLDLFVSFPLFLLRGEAPGKPAEPWLFYSYWGELGVRETPN